MAKKQDMAAMLDRFEADADKGTQHRCRTGPVRNGYTDCTG